MSSSLSSGVLFAVEGRGGSGAVEREEKTKTAKGVEGHWEVRLYEWLIRILDGDADKIS